MLEGRRFLAVVPARGGSKSVPRKNLLMLGGRPLLVHTLEQAAEVAEIAYDAGVQLGLGHPNQAAAPFDEILRQQTLEQLDNHPGEIERLSRELADEVYAAWLRFAEAAQRSG